MIQKGCGFPRLSGRDHGLFHLLTDTLHEWRLNRSAMRPFRRMLRMAHMAIRRANTYKTDTTGCKKPLEAAGVFLYNTHMGRDEEPDPDE